MRDNVRRSKTRIALVTAGVLVAAMLVGGVSGAVAEDGDGPSLTTADDSDVAGMGLPKWGDALIDGEPLAVALEALSARYPSVYNDVAVNYPENSLELRYNASADSDLVTEFSRDVARLPQVAGLYVVLQEQNFSLQESRSAVERIFNEKESWHRAFGSPMGTLYADETSGMIHIELDGPAVDFASSNFSEIYGIPVVYTARTNDPAVQVGPQGWQGA